MLSQCQSRPGNFQRTLSVMSIAAKRRTATPSRWMNQRRARRARRRCSPGADGRPPHQRGSEGWRSAQAPANHPTARASVAVRASDVLIACSRRTARQLPARTSPAGAHSTCRVSSTSANPRSGPIARHRGGPRKLSSAGPVSRTVSSQLCPRPALCLAGTRRRTYTSGQAITCGACGARLAEDPAASSRERKPCPACRSLARAFNTAVCGTIRLSGYMMSRHSPGDRDRSLPEAGIVRSYAGERQGRDGRLVERQALYDPDTDVARERVVDVKTVM